MKNILVLIFPCVVFASHVYSQNVGINILNPAGKLHIKGTADVSQLIIEGHSVQSNTSPLLRLRKSSGTDLLWIHADTSLNTFVGLFAAGSQQNFFGVSSAIDITTNRFVVGASGFMVSAGKVVFGKTN